MMTLPFQEELSELSQEARVAFATACCAHVSVLYGTFIAGNVVRRGPAMALTAAWGFATGAPDLVKLEVAKREVDQAYEGEDIGGTATEVLGAMTALLDACTETNAAKAALAAARALRAVDLFEGEPGVTEEAAWQQRVFTIASGLSAGPVVREAFAALITERLPWLDRLEE